MRFFPLLLLPLLLLAPPLASSATADLRITPEDIRFSKPTLISGDTIRLYGRIQNVGDVDVSGYVTFFQGTSILGNSQVISVIQGGAPEEVYIDFVVPSSTFNIRAEIRGTEPEDLAMDNNTAITSMFEPVADGDGDGVADGKDNCVSVKNPSQADADADGLGDECDPDDDNDGLSDEVEAEIGTKPTVADSDADGTMDPQDAFPTDPNQQVITKPAVTETFKGIVAKVAEGIKKEEEVGKVGEVEEGEEVKEAGLTFSPNAVFSYNHDSWKMFTFRVVGPMDFDDHSEWEFGDGVRSNKTEVTHTYDSSGAYPVTLTLVDAKGLTSSESTTVFVPFFSLQNPLIIALISILAVLLATGVWIWRLTGRKPL